MTVPEIRDSFNVVYELYDAAYSIFKEKGNFKGEYSPNAVKVRRVIQITKDLSIGAFKDIRILDLGCAEGVYSIEAGLRGAQVVGMDGRNERLRQGTAIAERLSLSNVRFIQEDVRNLSKERHGEFDTIFFLGLLYHLDVPDAFHVLDNIYQMCKNFVIIDTHVSLTPKSQVTHKGNTYFGHRYREHPDGDSAEVIQSRVMSSLDNPFSFWFTRESLFQLLCNTGFSTVLECHVPLEPTKPRDRATMVAFKRNRARISSYPWINNLSENEIRKRLGKEVFQVGDQEKTTAYFVKTGLNRFLRRLGYEIRKV